MLHHPLLNVLGDNRLAAAMNSPEVKATGKPFLDIVIAVLANLPAILADINNPAALIALILSLLNPTPPTPAA